MAAASQTFMPLAILFVSVQKPRLCAPLPPFSRPQISACSPLPPSPVEVRRLASLFLADMAQMCAPSLPPSPPL